MAFEVLMPQLGLTMEEGTISRWLKQEGDVVKTGDAIVEIATDKLTNEVISEHDGVLIKIIAQEGEDIPVKGLLAYIGQPGESVAQPVSAAPGPVAVPEAVVETVPVSTPIISSNGRVRISPLAKKTAEKLGIDYCNITGSGSYGRIRQQDILAAALISEKELSSDSAAAADTSIKKPVAFKTDLELMEGDTVEKFTNMRKVVAQRMLQSHMEIPPVTQNTKVDVTELMSFRKMLLAKTGRKYSINDLVLKATARVLGEHPEILVSFDDYQIIQRNHINIGMAVALDTGLIVPVIRDADKMGLDQLSTTAKNLAERARENRLTADEFKGSTFSVSNLGMFGVETFTPIINQPDAAILGVCAVQDELMMDDEGTVTKHQVMRLSLTYDHRLLDGAAAAKFIMDLRNLLETPMSILL